MRRVRLLPIVLCAACSLLVFKTIGIVTNGGYVLSGVTMASASGAAPAAAPAEGGAAGEITIPAEPTLDDAAPTIADPAPTIGEDAAAAAGHAAPAEGDAEAAPAAGGEHAAAPAEDHGATPAATDLAAAHVAADCPVEVAAPAEAGAPAAAAEKPAAAAEAHGGGDAEGGGITCLTLADAEAVKADAKGNLVPLSSEEGALVTQKALLARLSDRRTELESLQTELDMRSALVDAAEKRLEERASAVAAMEAQIGALVAEKKAMDDAQLKSVVGMYETMKPKEAAAVFNTLDMEVLLRVARTMNPRKMAPIMAKMDTKRAEELTVRLATIDPEPTVAQAVATGQDISALPQIIGQ